MNATTVKHLVDAYANCKEQESLQLIEQAIKRELGFSKITAIRALLPHEYQLAKSERGKIPAIKKVRERTGLSLKDAKELVESYL